MRAAIVLPCALHLAACYSPNAEVTSGNDDDDGSTGTVDTSGTQPTASSTTVDPDSSGDPSATVTSDSSSDITHGDTDEDAPPEITAFSVQGSQMPAEILMADDVVLLASVSDDIAVDRVEFYDGDTLVATDTTAPYRVEFLVTSADNGGHSYTAVAWDSSEQMDEAGPIPLSVAIDGRSVVELRENIFRSRDLFGLTSPYLVGDETAVYVVGQTSYQGANFTTYRASAAKYSLGLSQLWRSDYPTTVTNLTPHYYAHGRGALDDDADLLVPLKLGDAIDDAPVRVMRVDEATGVFGVALALPGTSGPATGGLTAGADHAVALATTGTEMSLYPSLLFGPSWTEPHLAGIAGGQAYALRLHTDATGAILIDGVAAGVAFLRKVSVDGDVLWTRQANDGDGPLGVGYSAVGPNDSVTQVIQRPTGTSLGLSMRTYDSDGNLTDDVILQEGDEMIPHDVAYDPAGALVIAAAHFPADDTTDSWVGRVFPNGDEVWSGPVGVDPGSERAYSVLARADGRLYVLGIANSASEFFELSGDVWVAELLL